MGNLLKKASEFLDRQWRRLPWWVRGLASARRWYLGIKGAPAVWSIVMTLLAGGAISAFLRSLPTSTKVMWGVAFVIGVFYFAGHIGAQLKARSGNVQLISDFKLQRLANEYSSDLLGILETRPNVVVSTATHIGRVINDHVRQEKESALDRYLSKHQSGIQGVINQAVERGFISNEEIEQAFEETRQAIQDEDLELDEDNAIARADSIIRLLDVIEERVSWTTHRAVTMP